MLAVLKSVSSLQREELQQQLHVEVLREHRPPPKRTPGSEE